MGILNKILEENNLTPYSPELLGVIEEKIDKMNSVIDDNQKNLKELKSNKKSYLNSIRESEQTNGKLSDINSSISDLKRHISVLLEEVNEIQSIKNIINYQSKLAGIKKEIGKVNQNDGLDLVSKLKNKA
ncbi:MAG: hypothetical protein PF638_00140 [Candidatus Delongbacteria bacterium]|jgi:chromosome segregation ATPase|nr:hypothetical protein [Candidatus Delongbacteria bacterium]